MRLVPIIIAFSFVGSLALAWFSGFLDPLATERVVAGPFHLVYREHRGPYRSAQYEMGDVARHLRGRGFEAGRGFAILKSNPGERSLCGIAGCIVDATPANLDPPYRDSLLPAAVSVTATLSARSMFSSMTASMRLRPEIRGYLRRHGLHQAGPIMEIYDLTNGRITYLAPIGANPALPLPREAGR